MPSACCWQCLAAQTPCLPASLHTTGPGHPAGGAFPLWLAPVQCRVLPITDGVADYAHAVAARMREAGIRVEVAGGECAAAMASTACQAAWLALLADALWQVLHAHLLRHGITCCADAGLPAGQSLQ